MKNFSNGRISIPSIFGKKFRILLVDDENLVQDLARSIFDDFPVYDLQTAGSIKKAEYLLSRQHFHLCFCDLGITDFNGDQYYLLKKFHKDLPFVIISGRASIECGAHCVSLGASCAFDKPDTLTGEFFKNILDRFLPRSVFLYGINGIQHTRYGEAIETLLAEKPDSVEQWARILDINERYLRKICSCCPLPLHHMVNACHLLDLLLTIDNNRLREDACSEVSFHKKLIDFYYLNKRPLDTFFRIAIRPSPSSNKK